MKKLKLSFSVCCFSLIFFVGCDTNKSDQTESEESIPALYLNDTSVTSYTQNFSSRAVDDPLPTALSTIIDMTAPGQDADLGKDNNPTNNDIDGINGFKFTRLNSNGNTYSVPPIDYASDPWSCVIDENTGFIWEVKTLSGLQDFNNRYTWYNSDSKTNGGHAGEINTDPKTCQQTLNNCNTEEYIKAINNLNDGKGLCGLNNWRLPLREELRSIIDYSVTEGAMVDTNYFPNAMSSDTWTSQTAYYGTTTGDQAWEVHFDTGHSEAHVKSSANVFIRLVHNPVN